MKTRNTELERFRKKARELVAQYLESEGCSCCEGPNHKEDGQILGDFLGMKRYSDNSGIDYTKYLPKKEKPFTEMFKKSKLFKTLPIPKPKSKTT